MAGWIQKLQAQLSKMLTEEPREGELYCTAAQVCLAGNEVRTWWCIQRPLTLKDLANVDSGQLSLLESVPPTEKLVGGWVQRLEDAMYKHVGYNVSAKVHERIETISTSALMDGDEEKLYQRLQQPLTMEELNGLAWHYESEKWEPEFIPEEKGWE